MSSFNRHARKFAFLLIRVCAFATLYSPLPAQSQTVSIEIVPSVAHEGDINSIVYSPDGRSLLTGSADGTAKLWDAESGKLLRTFVGHLDAVTSVAFSPDGMHVLSGSRDKTVKLWDAKTGQLLRTFLGHKWYVSTVAFSPNGNLVASGGLDLKVKIWDSADGKELHNLEGHACFVNAIAFSPDGKRLASASGSDFTSTSFAPCNDNTVKLWDVNSGQLIRTFSPHGCHVDTVTFLPGGVRVVTASGNDHNSPCSDHTIKIWNVENGETICTIDTGYVGKITAVAVLQNGARILAGGQYQHPLEGGPDKGIRLWDAETGELIRSYDGRSKGEQAPGALETIGGVAVSPNGARVAGVQWGRQLKMWDVPSGQLVHEINWRSHYINSIAFSSDDTSLVSSDLFGASVWDATRGNLERVFDENGKLDGFDTVQAVAYSPDGKAILMASGQRLKLFDIQSRNLILTLENSSQVQSVAFSDDGKLALSASWDGAIKLWDLRSGKLSRILNSGPGPGFGSVSATLSPDGSKVLAASDSNVLMWDVKSGAIAKKFSDEFASSLNSTAVKFSPGGKQVLFATWNNTMVLADATSGNEIIEFKAHEGRINSVAFAGNGARLLSGSSDATLKLWDTATGQPLRTFKGHGGPVLSVAFSHDGKRALSGSSDGTVKIWDTATGVNIITLIP